MLILHVLILLSLVVHASLAVHTLVVAVDDMLVVGMLAYTTFVAYVYTD